MATHYVFVDYENVQPTSLGTLKEKPYKIYLFLGQTQAKLSRELVKELLAFPGDVKLVEITGNGPNALDFHMAYYLGEIAAREPGAQFHLISGDKGFDPLVKHLKSRNGNHGKAVRVTRHPSLAGLPGQKPANGSLQNSNLEKIIQVLKARPKNRPRKLDTLRNFVDHNLGKKCNSVEIENLLKKLQSDHQIEIKDDSVHYKLN